MVKTLYVGNLAWSASNEELVQAFEASSPVISARVISDRETGRSKGFGFIEVADEDAEKVIKAMNGYSLGGRSITVSEARPKQAKM
ncbi:MAG TPA: RNA-binding protein [Candidatus Omnitrophota bacterium]|nr:RNA-binding protein [Candidatus Omnitrophota bacterium]